MKTKFFLDKKSFCARASMICMLLAIIFRAIGSIGSFTDQQFVIMRFALPAASCLLFIICILLFGKKAFWISFIPVIFGIVFFIMRILSNDNITAEKLQSTQIALCMALYVLIAVIYSCTVFGAIKTKILLVLMFGLAFAYHVVVEDYSAIKATQVAPKTIFMELGVLSIILGLFFASLGLKKYTKASDEKSKDVVPPIPGGIIVPTEPEPSDKPEEVTEPEEQEKKEEPEAKEEPAEKEDVVSDDPIKAEIVSEENEETKDNS